MSRLIFTLALLFAVTGCDPTFEECPPEEMPDEAPRCEGMPTWAKEITEAYGCNMSWTKDNCPVCEVWFTSDQDEPLVVTGGLCTQVPFCAGLYQDAFDEVPDAGPGADSGQTHKD